jgi:hypothetical protein
MQIAEAKGSKMHENKECGNNRPLWEGRYRFFTTG